MRSALYEGTLLHARTQGPVTTVAEAEALGAAAVAALRDRGAASYLHTG